MSRHFREAPAPANFGPSLAALLVTGLASASGLAAGLGIAHSPDSDLDAGSIMAICLPAMPLLIIPLLGMPGLHRWAIGWYWLLSVVVLLLYPAALIVCLIDFFGLTPGGARDTYHIYFPLILLAVTAPGLWYLLQLVQSVVAAVAEAALRARSIAR